MDLNLKQKAQRRADRITAFQEELAELEREQGLILTPEQRVHLDAHLKGVMASLTRQYGIDVTESSKRISWGIRLATLLGTVAFFAALVLFLHRIWGAVPPMGQPAILMVIPLLFLAAAEIAFRCGLDQYCVLLLGVAAGAAFVMELSAMGSIFNSAPSPHALIAWSVFALLLAYAYGIRLLLGAGLLLFCAYTASLLTAAGGSYWAGFIERPSALIPAALALYAFPELKAVRHSQDFSVVYRLCGAGMALWSILIMSTTGDLCCAGLPPRMLGAIYQLGGLGLSVGVIWHGLRLGRSSLVNLGAVSFVVFLFVRLHAWWWNWMPKYLFFLSLSLVALLLLFLFWRIHTRLGERSVP